GYPFEDPALEQLTAPYAAALSDHVGASPCVLAGHSYGGVIAFEIAHQFQKLGGSVESILLIDSWVKQPAPFQIVRHTLRHIWTQEPNSQSNSYRARRSWLATRWILGQMKNKIRHFFNISHLFN